MLELDLVKLSTDPTRSQVDLDLWHGWKNGGQKPEDLDKLFHQFRPAVRKAAHSYVSKGDADIPPSAIYAEYNKWLLRAFDTYDPNRGAGLGTWVNHNLSKAQRWIMSRRNFARIPEKRVYKDPGSFKRAQAILTDQFGREPTTFEMADHLGWPEKKVGLVQTELRKTLSSAAWVSDVSTVGPSKEAEILRNVRFNLSPEDLNVFDYTVGWAGKPKLRPSDIAIRLGMSASKVSKIRAKIKDEIDKYWGQI